MATECSNEVDSDFIYTLASLARYVYTYKKFDSGFKLLSIVHTVPGICFRNIQIDIELKTRTTKLNRDR